jgi:hypothetical protein
LNVNTKQLQDYIEAFHRSLETTAAEFLSDDHRDQLLHTSLLPARITGYISTQFGVGIEYESAAETSVRVVKGSARIEDLILKAPPAVRNVGPMLSVAASNVTLSNCNIEGAFPFRLAGLNSSITLRDVVLRAGSWFRIVQFAEASSNRNAEHWSVGRAESRAKDEVLAAMVLVTRAAKRNISISDYVEKFKDKTVLLLGDYDDAGMKRLVSISAALSSEGYEPLLIKDVPDHPYHDLPQKVVAIGAIARFIVVDDSSASGHLLEVQLCKLNSWVTVLLRAAGEGGSWMTAGAAHASNVIRELAYDPGKPGPAIVESSRWAEEKLKELAKKFESTYPWRAN